jgi:hypothetical protein
VCEVCCQSRLLTYILLVFDLFVSLQEYMKKDIGAASVRYVIVYTIMEFMIYVAITVGLLLCLKRDRMPATGSSPPTLVSPSLTRE